MNANEQLAQHTCTENYYRYFSLLATNGALALAETFQCFWFLDVIWSYQSKLKSEPFQVWLLTRTGSSATVTCTDGNDNVLITQRVAFTDFEPETATIRVENNVMLLPSER